MTISNLSRRVLLGGMASTALIPSLLSSASPVVLGAPAASWNVERIAAGINAILDANDGYVSNWTPEEMRARQSIANPKETWDWDSENPHFISRLA